jgi:hypothetical protein
MLAFYVAVFIEPLSEKLSFLNYCMDTYCYNKYTYVQIFVTGVTLNYFKINVL